MPVSDDCGKPTGCPALDRKQRCFPNVLTATSQHAEDKHPCQLSLVSHVLTHYRSFHTCSPILARLTRAHPLSPPHTCSPIIAPSHVLTHYRPLTRAHLLQVCVALLVLGRRVHLRLELLVQFRDLKQTRTLDVLETRDPHQYQRNTRCYICTV